MNVEYKKTDDGLFEITKYFMIKDPLLAYDYDIASNNIFLKKSCLLISKGFKWDGASFPAFNTKSFVRASLVHDAIYRLIRYKILPNTYRENADKLLYKIAREDGMWLFRALYCYYGVRLFGWCAV